MATSKGVALAAVLLGIAAACLRRTGLPMPYPCHLTVARQVDVTRLPRPRPLTSVYAPNDVLHQAQRLFEGQVHGAESVAVGSDEAMYLPDKYGQLWRAAANSTSGGYDTPEHIVYLGPGRPLGGHFDAQGNLLLCDALKGLIAVRLAAGAGGHRVELLASRVSDDSPLDAGTPIHYANDLDIAVDGTVYFSDSGEVTPVKNAQGFWDTMQAFLLLMLQGQPSGRLLAYSPTTGKTHVLAKGFWYANGVAVARDQSYVAVVETVSMGVHRHWLRGPKAGRTEVLIARLPGFPDGISTGPDGNHWLALVAPPSPIIQLLPYAAARWAVAWLPAWARPPVRVWGAALQVDPEGRVLRALFDVHGSRVSHISSVTHHGGRLLFGNLVGDYVSFLPVELLPPVMQ